MDKKFHYSLYIARSHVFLSYTSGLFHWDWSSRMISPVIGWQWNNLVGCGLNDLCQATTKHSRCEQLSVWWNATRILSKTSAKQTIIDLDNGLSPIWHQAHIWTNDVKNVSEIWIKTQQWFWKCHLQNITICSRLECVSACCVTEPEQKIWQNSNLILALCHVSHSVSHH